MPPKGLNKTEAKTEDKYVSLAQVNEQLQQQKEMFMALIQQQQQDSFRGFVKVITDSTNTRLESLSKELQDMKTSLQYTQNDEIKTSMSTQTDRCNSRQSDVLKVCGSLLAVTDKIQYLEGQSRRNNLVTRGDLGRQ